MHYLGKELISRNTYVSNRSLITVATVTVFSYHYELPLADLDFFGMSLPEANINSITLIFLIFLTINYYLSYFGDFISFTGWNVKPEIGDVSLSSKLDDMLDKIQRGLLRSKITYLDEAVQKEIESQNKDLENLLKGHSKLNIIAKLQLYFWFGAMPLFLSGYAIYLTL